MAGEFEARGFPTLKWFHNGAPVPATAALTTSDRHSRRLLWRSQGSRDCGVDPEEDAAAVDAHHGRGGTGRTDCRASRHISRTVSHSLQSNDVVTFGLFDREDSEEAQQFLIAADITKYPSAHSFDAAIGAKHGLKAPAVVLFKNVRFSIRARAAHMRRSSTTACPCSARPGARTISLRFSRLSQSPPCTTTARRRPRLQRRAATSR